MKLINSSFELLLQASGLEGIYKQIELGARNCYKSENLISEGSAERMVEFLKTKGHNSPLEHGTVYLFIPFSASLETYRDAKKYENNHYSKVRLRNDSFQLDKNGCYITTNFRVLVENNWLDDLKYLCEPAEYHEKRVSVMVTCPIGISREFNRHKICALYQ